MGHTLTDCCRTTSIYSYQPFHDGNTDENEPRGSSEELSPKQHRNTNNSSPSTSIPSNGHTANSSTENTRTESQPLATALEIMETERQKETEQMQTEQAKSPEQEIPRASVSTPDTKEEEGEKAKDTKEDHTQALTPNQDTQGRNNDVEIVEHATPPPSMEQFERRIIRSQARKKPKTA
jgi:hypothetical protein